MRLSINPDGRRHAKLDVDKVRQVKALLAEGRLSHGQLGLKFKVNRSTITKIKHGKAWADVQLISQELA